MKKRLCKNSGIELSEISTGCWAFGGGSYWGEQDQKDVNDVVHASVDFGINYFDTAEMYNEGRSESSLGLAIKGIPRDKLVIGSKVSPSNCYKKVLTAHCEASLKRLGVDCIDIYMIHWPVHPHSIRHFTKDARIIENPPDINESIEELRKLKKQGKIRSYGVSNFGRTRLESLPIGEISVDELPYNLLCRAIEYDTLPLCSENGIGVIGYMSLMQGILTDNYPALEEIPVMQRRTRHFNSKYNKEIRHGEDGAEDETKVALVGIRKISRETGLSMSEIAISWILDNQALTTTLAGSRNVKELKENINAAENSMDGSIKAALDKVTLPVMNKLGNHFDYWESASNDRTI